MAGEWQEATVKEIASSERNALVGGPFGSNLVSRDYVDHGVPVIRGQNMGERWVSGDFAYVTPEKALSLESNLARPGDIVFTQRGTLGQVCLVPEKPFDRYLVSQSQMKLTVNREIADPQFFYYVFRSAEQQDYIIQHTIQTGVPHTNLGILRQTPVPLPPLPEQCAIAHILGTLDDKIELNRRTNETLEAMARALFKSWFVDFDPVRAKAGGQARSDLDPAIGALFPDRFEDSELGEIPAGWRVGSMDELAMLCRESVNPADFPGETFDHYSIPAFDEGRVPKTEHGDAIKSNKLVVPRGSVLLSKLNPRIPRIWLPEVSPLRRGVCSTEFLVALPTQGVSREFLFGLFSSPSFSGVFATLVTGTSGSHQRVKLESLMGMVVAIPDESVIRSFTHAVEHLLLRGSRNVEEGRTLAALRDALLLKLLSGEIRINDAERLAGRAV